MSDEDYVEIPPDVHFIESIRVDRGSYATLLAEGVDNGFDAGATAIELELGKGIISIADDGIGITKDRELSLVSLGKHVPLITTALGRFGIGIKYQAISAGDVMQVESTSVDGKMWLRADWPAVIRGGKWRIPRPRWVQSVRLRTGTRVQISELRWPSPTQKDIDRARQQIGQSFYPAVAAGRSISLNGEAIKALQEPELMDVVEANVSLDNGKGAHVRAGLLAHPGQLNQVQVSLKHRVLMSRSVFGCGDYGGTTRLFARVDLFGPWIPTRFKDGLSDPDSDALQDQVQVCMRPLLEKCRSAHMSASVAEMTAMLNEMLPPELVHVRPLRSEAGDGNSRKKPRKQHGKAEGDDSKTGPARKKKSPVSPLMIEFVEGDGFSEEFGYGKFEPGRPNRIRLAQANPDVGRWLEQRDRADGKRALYLLAMAIYEQGRPDPPLDFDEFGKRLWKLREQQQIPSDSETVAQ